MSAPWRPGRRAKIIALVVAVLLVVGVIGRIVIVNHNAGAPVDAVREYVDAIARGDAATANRLVDPRRLGTGVDPALLTDKVLRSATERIKVVTVDRYDEDTTSDLVDVQVEYTLGTHYRATRLLRAQRSGATAGMLDQWRVIDPLLVPLRVESNEPELDTATLGAATVPVGGLTNQGWPERRMFVYPGVYELHGHESRYLTAPPETVVATHDSEGRASGKDQYVARGALDYRATPELTSAVADRLTKYATACAAAAPKVPSDCPVQLRLYADFGTDMRIDRQPVVDSIQSYQTKPDDDVPSLRAIAKGRFSYLYKGGREQEDFTAYARIVVTPKDDLTITVSTKL